MSKTIKERYALISKNIQVAEEELRKHQHELTMLQEIHCEHPNIKDDYGTGECPDCGYETKGWFCPTSPTKECDYYDTETGEYDDDCCVYCGDPEERK